MIGSRNERPGGFTLIELLVVLVIVLLVSVATLPTVIPALQHRQVSESARILQAALAGSRDAAIRANAPRGIRLLPDPVFNGQAGTLRLAANRWISIEPAPDYSEGRLSGDYPPELLPRARATPPQLGFEIADPRLVVHEEKVILPPPSLALNPNYAPTSWYYNIRQGEKIRLGESGRAYTIAGPMFVGTAAGNPERFINAGPPVNSSVDRSGPWEILFLVNGQDDDGDGYVDESFDGIDNDGDGIVDPGFNGVDDNGDGVVDEFAELFIGFVAGNNATGEYEPEALVGAQSAAGSINQPYLIERRPTVSPGAREVTLPSGVVIDMTTWNAPNAVLNAAGAPLPPGTIPPVPERSRVPVDPYTRTVDILIAPNGQVVPAGAGKSPVNFNAAAPTSTLPFYHLWIAERDDVQEPLWGAYPATNPIYPVVNPGTTAAGGVRYLLPLPEGTPDPTTGNPIPQTTPLQGERRLVTLFTRTGQILTSDLSREPTVARSGIVYGSFNPTDQNAPYYDAQIGVREVR